MAKGIRFIAQEYDLKSGKITREEILHEKKVVYPKKIDQLGFCHLEQITLLQQSQDFLLHSQLIEINTREQCPNCGKQTKKLGQFKSSFHAVFTDHEMLLQRRVCSCGWKSHTSIQGLYGNDLHPDLMEMQSELGSMTSFQKASKIMAKKCQKVRAINNDARIQRTVVKVGELLGHIKQRKQWVTTPRAAANELVMQIDGGHLKSKLSNKNSFEALVTTVYHQQDIERVDKNHAVLKHKISVASAKNDQLKTIKNLSLNACYKQGMTAKTHLIALSDGAKNCLNVIHYVAGKCRSVLIILDWFHIGKRFKILESFIPSEQKPLYEKIKWHLWHGKVSTSLLRLHQLEAALTDPAILKKLASLKKYITNNQLYITNYHARRLQMLPYTSHIAESSIDLVINERQKRNQKMQWSRTGADAILQIRTSFISRTWPKDWAATKPHLYSMAA